MSVLEWRNPLFRVPTTGAIAGDELYYLANSQVDVFGPDAALPPLSKLASPAILKTRLWPL